MAKFKNAIRKHYIAPYDPEHPDTPPTDDKYRWIAKGIKESAPENDAEDDDVAYFDGDGTKEKSSLLNLVVVHSKDTVTMVIKLKTLLLIKKTL